MPQLQWSTSHAVFVAEIDDEHKEIFEALWRLRKGLAAGDPEPEIRTKTQRLTTSIAGHFAHEQRLMRAARYGSMRWHKQQHDAAARRVRQFVQGIEQGDAEAGTELVRYLSSWLSNHTQIADRMLGAFLRNHRRAGKLTFRFATRPVESCDWVDANGEKLPPGPDRE